VTKRVLGRGLGALLSDNVGDETSAGTGERVVDVAIAAISPNPFQPRKTIPDEKIRELADSIREKGVLQPIIVRRAPDEGFEIIAGERRYRAARSLGLETIPAIVREVPDRELLELALIENIQRENLDEIELAMAFEQLITDCAYTHQELAARLGKERTSVTNTLRLLKLPERVRAAVSSGEISAGHARALAGLTSPEAQQQWCDRIAREGLSVRALESLIAATPASRMRRQRRIRTRRDDVTLRDFNERLQTALGTRTTIRRTGRGGRIEIEFYSEDELERLLELLLREQP
jgi:ParB family transcriptional regulator, chromosome partitioning protein